MPNITLVGFMGTGKTSVGKRLAREMGLRFLDMDYLIEKEAGLPVSEIFSKSGEGGFRLLEKDAVRKLTSGVYGSGIVVAAGGGAVSDAENRRALRQWSVVICLTASVDEILKRAGNNDERPLLNTPDRRKTVLALLEKREGAYRDSDFTVDTTGIGINEAVSAIKAFLDKKASSG
ncbi:MAG: shikimate kinase [Deltaproteobacteria bacterium]|nr:shikimate kinase [Deltaproteobacteria bacterium]